MKKTPDFKDIYEQCYLRSFLFVKSYVHDKMVAEDIVAETLVKYWLLLSSGEKEASESLLITMLKNKSLDHIKHEIVRINFMDTITEYNQRELDIRLSTLEACDPVEIYSNEIHAIVKRTLESLPPLTRKIFEMSRFENKSILEIAEATNLTTKGVEYHITKSIKELRIRLKDYLPLLSFYLYNF